MKEKPLKPISSIKYLTEHDAAVCPMCLSDQIESGRCEMDGSIGTALVTCNKCGSYWTDVWIVKGYSNLNFNMTPEALDEVQSKAKAEREKGNFLLTPSVK